MRSRAKVQRFKPMVVGQMVTKERAALPCGCCMFVGRDVMEHKVTTGAQPCSEEHELVTSRASDLLSETIGRPRKRRLLVEACAEVLSAAAREMGV